MSIVNEILTEQEIAVLAIARVYGRLARDFADRGRAIRDAGGEPREDAEYERLLQAVVETDVLLCNAARATVDGADHRFATSPPVTPVTEPLLPEDDEPTLPLVMRPSNDQDEGTLGEERGS